MNNLVGNSKDIIKVAFWTNLIVFIISIFFNGGVAIISFINFIFLGSFFTIDKYTDKFGEMIQTQKTSKKLNNVLGKMYG